MQPAHPGTDRYSVGCSRVIRNSVFKFFELRPEAEIGRTKDSSDCFDVVFSNVRSGQRNSHGRLRFKSNFVPRGVPVNTSTIFSDAWPSPYGLVIPSSDF